MLLGKGVGIVHGVGPVPVHPVLHLALGVVVLVLLKVVDKEVYVERIGTAEACVHAKLRAHGKTLDRCKADVRCGEQAIFACA